LGIAADTRRPVQRLRAMAQRLTDGSDLFGDAISLFFKEGVCTFAHGTDQLGTHLLGVFDHPAALRLAMRGADRGSGPSSVVLRKRAGTELFGVGHLSASSACPDRRKINWKSLPQRTVCALARFRLAADADMLSSS